MLDEVILVTPFLVLGVLLLLGFAGCSFEGAVGTPAFSFQVRVPTALTVTEIVYRATKPGGGSVNEKVTNPSPSWTDGDQNVFFFSDGEPAMGGWTVSPLVTVSQNGATAQDGPQPPVPVMVDGSDDFPTANFQASGTPSAGNFDVVYTGLT